MGIGFLAAALAGAAGPAGAQDAPVPVEAAPRIRYTINDSWRYGSGPIPDAASPAYDDTGWERVDLPHTWNLEDSRDESPGYRRGVGWYRRTLVPERALRGRRLFLHFEGANQVADVFLNGERLGRHVGGYTAFAFEITDRVRWDAPNLLAVRVDNSHDPDIPPLDADFTFYGGIYRDVWLIATGPVHVTLLDHASSGIFIDTPEVSKSAASVRVQGTVVNATDAPRTVEVVSRVIDPTGTQVDALTSRLEIPGAGEAAFLQRSDRIRDPRLWSPAEPNVYTVVTEIHDGGRVLDRLENPLGFRWFRIDPGRGFFLNGAPLRLIGANRHQDAAGYGNAVPDALHRRDIERIKATGFDFLRLAHYPQDPAVVDAMDRVGLVGWEEIPIVNMISMSDAFAANAERMLVEMIRQHYNHPSILFWGYMNEVMLRQPDPLPGGYREAIVALARRLDATVHAEDPHRATVTAISFEEIDNGTGFQDIPDVLGLNLYLGWYYRSLDQLAPFLDSLHARNPRRPLMISEFGAGSDERIHALEPRPFDFSTEYQQRFHEAYLPRILDRPWLVGAAVWIQFDFASAGRNDSRPKINQKGLLRYDRTPKDVWYYYRARLRSDPVLHIATRDWPRRAGSRRGDARQPIVVYSNLPAVELRLNGASLGRQPVTNGSARWMVPLAPGRNRLAARGRTGETELWDVARVTYEDRTGLFNGSGRSTANAAPNGSPGSRGAGGPGTPREIAVNAGGGYQYVDGAGTIWEPDRAYEPGWWGHRGGEARLDHERIRGTTDDALYQATREGAATYRFDVPDGEYEIRILLAETLHDEPGQRTVTVRVNGIPLFAGRDLAVEPGPNAAAERSARVRAAGNRGVVVDASGALAGILLRRQ